MPSSSKGWLRRCSLPVRVRLGRGAAHVCGLRRSPLLQEPARVSKQSLGRWENKPPRTLAFKDAVQQDRARSSQADPCVSSEAAGSPALLP
jgi:hypothetical protein